LVSRGFAIPAGKVREEPSVAKWFHQLWFDERGQDVAEYAVMLAVVLVIVVGTIRLIGANANNVFSQVSSSIAQ
jgi:Flp pilus assembly pilin Flp